MKVIRFKRFLEIGLERRAFFGDADILFAVAAISDRRFRDFNNWDALLEFLTSDGASKDTIETAHKLFKKWKAGQ